MNTRIALVAALAGIFAAPSARAQFGYFPLRQEIYTSDLKSFRDAENSRRRLEQSELELARTIRMAELWAETDAAKERNRILEHAEAAKKLLNAVPYGDAPKLEEAVGRAKTHYPAADYDKDFQALLLYHAERVRAPQKTISNLVSYFGRLNTELVQKQKKREAVARIAEAARAEKSEAEIQAMRQRLTASEQRALDLEDRLRYDQFERYEQNRILNSRINDANQRLRDAEWEAAQRSRFPFIQSQP